MTINILKQKHLFISSVLFSVLILPTFAFSVEGIQSHTSIREAAHSHAISNASGYSMPPTVTVNRLDSRLRLPQCSQPLETFSPPAGRKLGRTTIGVRCSGNKPWSLYVPVMVSMITDVTVTAHNLARGTILSATDLIVVKKDITQLRSDFLGQPQKAIGKRLKRNLQQGQVLQSRHMVVPHVVKKGSKIIILASSSKIQVRMPGKALSNGAMGELIPVQNAHSKKRLEATVISPGVVRVAM